MLVAQKASNLVAWLAVKLAEMMVAPKAEKMDDSWVVWLAVKWAVQWAALMVAWLAELKVALMAVSMDDYSAENLVV
jgi:hypothetical protein